MTQASERSIFVLNQYAKFHFHGTGGGGNKAKFLKYVGLTEAEYDLLLSGEMLLDEPRFYRLLERCRDFDYSSQRGKLPDWYIDTPNWELIGLVERSITLKKLSGEEITGIQGIIKTPTAIIDDSDIYIEEGDCLTRVLKEGQEERLYVEEVKSNKYQTGKPAYVLKVRRCVTKMDKEKKSTISINGDNNNVVNGDNSSVSVPKKGKLAILTEAIKEIRGLFQQ